ncbi:MAG: TolC family protein [Armatimonadota bacterium]
MSPLIKKRHSWLATVAVMLMAIPLAAQTQPSPPEALTLQAATDYALANNPELLGMQQEVRMAEANLRLARAARGVTASLSAYATSATASNMITAPAEVMPDDMRMADPGRALAADVRISKSLSSGGRLGAGITQRQRLLVATEADIEAARLQVYYDTRAAYRMVLGRQKLLDVRRKEVEALQELVRVDEVKLEAGKIPLYYFLRDKTRLADAQQELTNAQRDVEVGLYELSVMLGLERPRQLTLTDALGFVPLETNEEDALKAAAANRPELTAVRARIAAASAGIEVARAAYRPQVAATVIFDAMTDFGDMGSSGGYTAALVGSLPLLDAGSRGAEVAMAQAQQQQLTQRERQLTQSIARDVLTAQSSLKAADQNIRTSLEAQASAEEDYRAARLRYDVGKAINLEPLDALASLVRARVNAAQALYEYNNAVDALQRATGRYAPAESPTVTRDNNQ